MGAKLKKAKESTEETDETDETNEETTEETNEETTEEKTTRLEQENEDLRTKNSDLKASKTPAPEIKGRITSEQLLNMSEKERETIEEQTGKEFDTIIRLVQTQESQARAGASTAIQARLDVQDALDAEFDKNPNAKKLRGHIREFLADVPDSDKTDPEKLKRHIDRAVNYAKGKAGVSEVKRTGKVGKTSRPEDVVDDEDEPEFASDPEKKIPPGRYQLGKDFTIEIEDHMTDDMRKKTKHPTRGGHAIEIPKNFDPEPKF